MPRRRQPQKREILPDPTYKSTLLAKFINTVMEHGKKSTAERIVYGALDIVVTKLASTGKLVTSSESETAEAGKVADATADSEGSSQKDAITAFKKALEKVTPYVEVKSRRVGGSTYQVPVEIRPNRRMALAMRWLAESARKRNEKSMRERLAHEILDAIEERGGAFKKRIEAHKMAEANKAFAHYRW